MAGEDGEVRFLWRGMRNVRTDGFTSMGGTEARVANI